MNNMMHQFQRVVFYKYLMSQSISQHQRTVQSKRGQPAIRTTMDSSQELPQVYSGLQHSLEQSLKHTVLENLYTSIFPATQAFNKSWISVRSKVGDELKVPSGFNVYELGGGSKLGIPFEFESPKRLLSSGTLKTDSSKDHQKNMLKSWR